ncbi:hypothetical protein GCM10020255_024040 [Rhodococcus baikonurensis]
MARAVGPRIPNLRRAGRSDQPGGRERVRTLTRAALDAGATEHDIDAIFDRLKAKNIAQALTTS